MKSSLLGVFALAAFGISSAYFESGNRNDVTGDVLQAIIGEEKDARPMRIKQLSWEPRAYEIQNFMSYKECEHLIELSEHKLELTPVVDQATGNPTQSNVRTSMGTGLAFNQTETVLAIEKRVAALTMLPVENQEGFQMLRYKNGQKYEAHHDYFYDEVNPLPEHGGQRIATVLMYLAEVEEGGETVFPMADHQGGDFSQCATKGLATKPTKGNALLFWNLKPDGTKDPNSLHESCPTLKGTKWTATKWIRVGVRNKEARVLSGCVNNYDDYSCHYWAERGECNKKQEFMHVECRKSCGLCKKKDTQV